MGAANWKIEKAKKNTCNGC